MQIQFKIMAGVVFYSKNGRSWMERCGDYKVEYAAWLAQQTS